MRMGGVRILALLLLSVLALSSCKKEEEKPETPPPPPPPSASVILGEYNTAIAPLTRSIQGAGGVMPQETEAMVGQVRATKGKHAANPNAPEANSSFKEGLAGLITQARDTEKWAVVEGAVLCYLEMDPSSTAYTKLLERARRYLKRPNVKVTGFIEIDNETLVVLEVSERGSSEKDIFKVRVGEEFYEKDGKDQLKLNRIIGNNQEVELLYDGDIDWRVPGPDNK